MFMHYIQKHILKTLMYTKWARFRDMRPPRVDSNAYSYHLRALQKDGLVEKTDNGYWLTPAGLSYVDKVSLEKFEPRIQPKLTNMLVIQNEKDQVLLIQKSKQPFINTWMLPYGKVHLDDESFYAAAVREADEKLQIQPEGLEHKGSCYIRAHIKGTLISSLLANIFATRIKGNVELGKHAQWFERAELDDLKLAPATTLVIDKVLSSKGLFFEQYNTDW
jgi:ADP-ribose pyrophosphatase YjhB (NUDIX family)